MVFEHALGDEPASPFCRDALRDLRAQLVPVGGGQLLALLEEPQGLDHDLVDRLEASRLELGADQLLHLVGQGRQIQRGGIPAPIMQPSGQVASLRR